MSEPTMLILGSRERRTGRPTKYGAPLNRRLVVSTTDDQEKDVKEIAGLEKRPVADLVRDAIDEYVSDFRERRVFKPKKR